MLKNKDGFTVSEWQEGAPPCDGIYEIRVPEHDVPDMGDCTYYARFKNGQWGIGADWVSDHPYHHDSYPSNNDPTNPRKWRGVIDE